MTREIEADVGEVVGLLQPFIDGELEGEEYRLVAEEVARSPEYAQIVEQQREIQSLLADLGHELAPPQLRARVLHDLDAADAADKAAGRSGWLAPVVGRIQAFGRGGLLMVPAAAAALALFFFVRGGFDTTVPGLEGAHVDGGMASSLNISGVHERAREAGAPDDGRDLDHDLVGAAMDASDRRDPHPAGDGLATVDEQGFAVQVAPARSLPKGTALVADGTSGSVSSAQVRYQNALGQLMLDTQRSARVARSTGTRQVFRGHIYFLSRDARGRARVEFSLGGVHHSLVLGTGPGRAEAETSVEEPGFAGLLEVGEALHRAHGQ